MKNNSILKAFLPHLIVIGTFIILMFIYFSPVLSGKSLFQNDQIQVVGSLKESLDYQQQTGEEILWSGTGFSGMPVWRGFSNNWLNVIHDSLLTLFPGVTSIVFLAFLGFYILMLSLRLNAWLSFAGAIAFTFSTFNFISLEAGHFNKVYNMALMAPVLAGIFLTLRGKYLIGAAVTTLFTGLQIYYGHIQITYYLIIIILFMMIAEFITAYKNKTLKSFFVACGILLVSALIAVAPNISRLWTMKEYAESTTRGGSELTAKKTEGGGLDKDYVTAWSNGIIEPMTILIPGFHGGSSTEDLGVKSETYKTLLANGVPRQEAKEYIENMPLYWGDQPFTSGPIYFGAIVVFLFVLGLILIKGPLKWWVLAVSILSIMLSFGKNLEWLTDFFFYNVPLYNKFRSVTMTMSMAQLMFPFLGFIVLKRIIQGEFTKEEALKGIKLAFYITGGISLFFALFGGAFFEFTGANDAQLPEWLRNSLLEDRQSRLRIDAFRSLIFILLAALLIWAILEKKIKDTYFYIAFSLLILIDQWPINKRYLDNEDFKNRKKIENEIFVATPVDEEILRDKDPNFRVINLTKNPFTDAVTSYFHKSIGGYSAIKLGRYQELIENHISQNNMAVLNMLNTKYFIIADQNTKQPIVQQNPNALGNAWFVNDVKIVKNADEELNALKNFNPASTAFVDQRFADELKQTDFKTEPSADIKFVSYHPHRMVYESNNPNPGFAVFSEIYFTPGWNAYIDGMLTEYVRANYVLRGLPVPQGKHTIEFKFEPNYYYVGEKISLAGSIVFFAIILLGFGIKILQVLGVVKDNKSLT